MWVVSVRWRDRGGWVQVEACHGDELAFELANEYRADGHAALVWWREEGSFCSLAV